MGSTAVQYRGVDRGRDPGKLRRGRGGDRASTRGNGCSGGPRTPCGARTRCRCAVARKARTGLPWEIPLPGGLGTLGGRAWTWALPRQREGGLPGRGVSESAGRGAPKQGRGPKGSTGEGTPRRDPGGPAGRSRPNGRVVATKRPQPRRPRPICGGAVRPTGPATAVPRLGNGARCPGKPPGQLPAKQGRSPTASCERSRGGGQRGPRALRPWNLRASGMPLSRRAHPYSPPPTSGGFRRYGGPPSRRCAFVQG